MDPFFPLKQYRIVLSILLIELAIYFFSDAHAFALSGNTFIGFEQDPLLWMMYLTGLPQYFISIPPLCICLNAGIIILLLRLIFKPSNNKIAWLLLVLLFIFYCIFIGHLGHKNYQSGYLFLLLPLLFNKTESRQIMFECTRYFLLFFYVSAAIFKIKSGALFNDGHFSHALVNQFTPYYLEQHFTMRTSFNTFLITHPSIANFLFAAGTFLELLPIIGFFSKRYDRILFVLLITFHLVNWFIMDIGPWGQIAFISTIFFSKNFSWKITPNYL